MSDTGPGIPASVAPDLFKPFSTGTGQREGAGAGLGLSICRELVERMDGTIALDGPDQPGAAFSFGFVLYDVPAQDETLPEAPAPTPHDTLHVLVADDNATNRLVASTLLNTFGCTSDAVENGAQAVEALQTRAYDLVLMDIKMPVMDGVEATGAIRRLAGAAAQVPIIALTANADPSDQRSYIEAGMDDVVEKPIKAEVLLAAIRRAMTAPETVDAQAA